jgi:hypothetical protein
MTTLSGILDAYEASIKPDKPIPALQGAFIAGAYQTTVASDPSLVYVRMLDNTVTRAKHRNRLNLTDPNQNIPIALYYDEYDQLSVWGIEPNQAGAVLQGSPVAGAGGVKSVVAGSGITVDNTDPVNPIVSAGAAASGVLFVMDIIDFVVTNTVADSSLFGAGVGDRNIAAGTYVVGDMMEIVISGIMSSDAIAPGNFSFHVGFSGNYAVDSGSVAIPLGLTDASFTLRCWFFPTDVGGSGLFYGSGDLFISTGAGLATYIPLLNVGITADTTAGLLVEAAIQYDTADPDNSINPQIAFLRKIKA